MLKINKFITLIFVTILFSCSNTKEEIILQNGVSKSEVIQNQVEQQITKGEKQQIYRVYYDTFYQNAEKLEGNQQFSKLAKEKQLEFLSGYFEEGKRNNKDSIYAIKIKNLLETQPQDFDNLYYLGLAEMNIKNYTQGLIYFHQAQNISFLTNEQEAILFNQIGYLHYLKGEIETAYGYYYKAYNIDNMNPDIVYNMALYLQAKSEIKTAQEYFNYAKFMKEVVVVPSK